MLTLRHMYTFQLLQTNPDSIPKPQTLVSQLKCIYFKCPLPFACKPNNMLTLKPMQDPAAFIQQPTAPLYDPDMSTAPSVAFSWAN